MQELHKITSKILTKFFYGCKMQSVKARLLGLRVQNRNLAFRNQNNFIYEEGKGVFNVFLH